MNPASIPVDLRNPGQVFACLGLMEMTEVLNGPCMMRFNYSSNETLCRFELDTSEDCIEKAVRFLARCKVVAIAPPRTPGNEPLSAVRWQVETVTVVGQFFPGAPPDSPATLPVHFSFGGVHIPVEHWLDDLRRTGRDNVKFWAGAGGYPGAALARDSVSLLSPFDDAALSRIALDPFAFSAPMDSSFRFDWRRDYIPLDAGFSPNDQSSISMVGFPLVELLAAVGLQNARPSRLDPRNKLAYRYNVSNAWLPPCLARAVLGSRVTGFPVRAFRMNLGWPGKENQARCITNAEEE
jgi:CRISPR-associated protein Csb3